MNLQTTFKTVLIAFISISIFSISACKKEETPDRDKFLGSYNANENCDSGNDSYSITVSTSTTSEDDIIITNLYNANQGVRATVSGSNININDTKGGVTYSGSGSISGNTFTIIFSASAGGLTDDCTATAIKQ